MKQYHFKSLARLTALFLCFALSLPNPAFALRVQSSAEFPKTLAEIKAGMEEVAPAVRTILQSLLDGNQGDSQRVERLAGWLQQTDVGQDETVQFFTSLFWLADQPEIRQMMFSSFTDDTEAARAVTDRFLMAIASNANLIHTRFNSKGDVVYLVSGPPAYQSLYYALRALLGGVSTEERGRVSKRLADLIGSHEKYLALKDQFGECRFYLHEADMDAQLRDAYGARGYIQYKQIGEIHWSKSDHDLSDRADETLGHVEALFALLAYGVMREQDSSRGIEVATQVYDRYTDDEIKAINQERTLPYKILEVTVGRANWKVLGNNMRSHYQELRQIILPAIDDARANPSRTEILLYRALERLTDASLLYAAFLSFNQGSAREQVASLDQIDSLEKEEAEVRQEIGRMQEEMGHLKRQRLDALGISSGLEEGARDGISRWDFLRKGTVRKLVQRFALVTAGVVVGAAGVPVVNNLVASAPQPPAKVVPEVPGAAKPHAPVAPAEQFGVEGNAEKEFTSERVRLKILIPENRKGGKEKDLVAATQVDKEPVGALASLRKAIGKEKKLGIITWGPDREEDLTHLVGTQKDPGILSLAVKTDLDVIFISGWRFVHLDPRIQQAIINEANKAGLKTIGFIDGDFDWPENPEFVARFYRALVMALARLNLGRLKIAFSTDIEPHNIPKEKQKQGKKFDGNLKPSMDLIEKVSLPVIGAFARTKKGVVDGPLLTRVEPWWFKNGHKPDDSPALVKGAVLKGLRSIQGTELAGMTYRDTEEDITKVSENLFERAKNEKTTAQIMVETIPKEKSGTPSFAGNETKIGPVLRKVYEDLPAERKTKVRGFIIHAENMKEARRILQDLSESSPKKGVKVKPAQKFEVRARVAVTQIAMDFSLDMDLVKEGDIAKDLIAVPVVQTDIYYPQPKGDGSVLFSVTISRGGRGEVRVVAAPQSPFYGGKTNGRAVLLIPKKEAPAFFEKHGKGASKLKVGEDGILKIIQFDNKGKPEVVEELSAGLEEGTVQFLSRTYEQAVALVSEHSPQNLMIQNGSVRLNSLRVITSLESGDAVKRFQAAVLDFFGAEARTTIRYDIFLQLESRQMFVVANPTAAGLEEVDKRVAAATNSFDGLFKDGTELADKQVIPHLNLVGRRITRVIDLDHDQLKDIEPADVAAIGQIFTHDEKLIPEAWRGRSHKILPRDPNVAESFLVKEDAGVTDLALVAPEIAGDNIAEWSRILEGRKTPGIVMTQAVLDAIDKLKQNAPKDFAILLTAIRQAGGIVLGFKIEQEAGQRKLYLWA